MLFLATPRKFSRGKSSRTYWRDDLSVRRFVYVNWESWRRAGDARIEFNRRRWRVGASGGRGGGSARRLGPENVCFLSRNPGGQSVAANPNRFNRFGQDAGCTRMREDTTSAVGRAECSCGN